jgi:hypothetical protein
VKKPREAVNIVSFANRRLHVTGMSACIILERRVKPFPYFPVDSFFCREEWNYACVRLNEPANVSTFSTPLRRNSDDGSA